MNESVSIRYSLDDNSTEVETRTLKFVIISIAAIIQVLKVQARGHQLIKINTIVSCPCSLSSVKLLDIHSNVVSFIKLIKQRQHKFQDHVNYHN
jgi:hypothetical protein